MKISYCENIYGSFRQPKLKGKVGKISVYTLIEIDSLKEFLKNKKGKISGSIVMEDVAKCSNINGLITIDPIFSSQIAYEFDFICDNEEKYRFIGKKHIRLLNPLFSLTKFNAKIMKCDSCFAEAEMSSHYLELPKFLSSISISFK